ncbi:MAG: hypothetical protein ACFCUE_09300 [Candidatus Bathyarchaeia archaeon]
MKSKKLIVFSLLATLLVSTAFASFANAEDDNTKPQSIEPVGPDIASPPDMPREAGRADIAEPTSPDSSVSSDEPTLYPDMQGLDSTTGDDFQIQGDAEVNLVSEVAGGAVDPWFILGLMGVCSLGLGSVVGVVLYRRVKIR